MFVLCTDFGLDGPYLGQMTGVLSARAPGVPVVNLFADLPRFDPCSAAYLVAAYADGFPPDSVFVCVVDPGVGGARDIVMLRTPSGWFVGPDNGLLAVVARRFPGRCEVRRLDWRSASTSATFHGRDIMAPAAAALALGAMPNSIPIPPDRLVGAEWPDDRFAVAYIDHYGNAITGVRADAWLGAETLRVGTRDLPRARTFGDVTPGTAFWYANSAGLVEIAVNRGRADEILGLRIGMPVAPG